MEDFKVENICYPSLFCENNKPFESVHIVAVCLDFKTSLIGTKCNFDPKVVMRWMVIPNLRV